MAITGARPLGVTNCLNYRRPDAARRRSGSSGGRARPGRCVPRARAARHRWQCLASTTSRPPGPSRPRPRSASSGCSTTSRPSSGPPSIASARRRARCGEAVRRARQDRRMPGLPAPRPRTARPRSTWRARRRCRRSSARPIARGLVALRAGRVGRRARGGARRVRDVGQARGAASDVAVRHSPAVDLFGESPSRLVVSCRPRYAAALTLLARQHGAAGRDGRARSAASAWSSSSPGPVPPVPPRSAGAGVADAARGAAAATSRHAWEHGLARALGWEG